MRDLENIRKDINKIDKKIISLLNQRFFLSKEVGAYKKAHDMKIFDENREKEILEKINDENKEYGEFLAEIYQKIMDLSKDLQKERFGLLGKNLGHSFSKLIHTKITSDNFEFFDLDEKKLDEFFENKDFKGINVTMPYKKDVIKYLDKLSSKAKKIGAVNTIVNNKGKLEGYNTDYDGFLYNLRAHGIDVKDKKCLILGKGATSKTVEVVLKDQKARKIVKLSRRFKPYFEDVADFYDYEIIINATPVGMYPNNGGYLKDIDLSKFKDLYALVDCVYNPLMTKILIDANLKNIKNASGLDMLIGQGVRASELFLGKNHDVSVIKAIKKDILEKRKNIALIGMPGSGKTSLGEKLSQKLNKDFVDTDQVFEKKYGNIEEFFKKYGEDEFRKKESAIIREVCKNNGLIIGCGGGVVERFENYYPLKENSLIVEVKRDTKNLDIKKRPLSKKRGVEEIYKRRKDLYKTFRDCEIKNDSLDRAVDEIIRKFYEDISN